MTSHVSVPSLVFVVVVVGLMHVGCRIVGKGGGTVALGETDVAPGDWPLVCQRARQLMGRPFLLD